MSEILTVPLQGCVAGGADIEILRAELRSELVSSLALIRYSERGQEPKYGVRLDLDKKVFIDHLADAQQERIMQQAAPELADILNRFRQDVRHSRYKPATQAARSAVAYTEGKGKQTLNNMVEELEVGKRQVQRGGVRVYSHVTETPVEASVNLREEHVTIERHAVNKPVDAATLNNINMGVIEVTTTAKAPIMAKEAHAVEVVGGGKVATERTETVQDTVRRTDVEVEQIAS